MEEKPKIIESLLEKAVDYGKTSYELGKLKIVDKTSDVVSSIVPHSVVFFMFVFFMLFGNLGLALWLNEILANNYYGFLIVAAFYGFLGIVIHLFMHKWLKRIVSDYFIKRVLN